MKSTLAARAIAIAIGVGATGVGAAYTLHLPVGWTLLAVFGLLQFATLVKSAK